MFTYIVVRKIRERKVDLVEVGVVGSFFFAMTFSPMIFYKFSIGFKLHSVAAISKS